VEPLALAALPSTRLSSTLGAVTSMAPATVFTVRVSARPLRTTSL